MANRFQAWIDGAGVGEMTRAAVKLLAEQLDKAKISEEGARDMLWAALCRLELLAWRTVKKPDDEADKFCLSEARCISSDMLTRLALPSTIEISRAAEIDRIICDHVAAYCTIRRNRAAAAAKEVEHGH